MRAARKNNLLVACQKRAEGEEHVHEVMAELTDTSAFDSFDRKAAKVEQIEAHANAAVEVSQELSGHAMEGRFRASKSSTDVEQELHALKAKFQKEIPSPR